MTKPTQKEVQKLFTYDPKTGKLFKKFSCRKEAGSFMNGYRRVSIKYKNYLIHRIIWLYNYGEFPKGNIDHINSCRWDNKLENLRILSHTENAINTLNRSHNTSGIVGVSWHKNSSKWQARISNKRKNIALGIYTSFDKAVKVRYEAEIKYNYHLININSSAKKYLIEKNLI